MDDLTKKQLHDASNALVDDLRLHYSDKKAVEIITKAIALAEIIEKVGIPFRDRDLPEVFQFLSNAFKLVQEESDRIAKEKREKGE